MIHICADEIRMAMQGIGLLGGVLIYARDAWCRAKIWFRTRKAPACH